MRIEARLHHDLDVIRERFAVEISNARRRLLEGDEDAAIPFDEIEREGCNFYQNEIVPLFPQAEGNCPLLNVLAGFILGISRQMQLLGFDACTPSIADLPPCPGVRNCFDEIKQCCASKPASRNVVRVDYMSLNRQQQLLGLDCVSHEEIQTALEDCTDYVWTGTMKIVKTGGILDDRIPGLFRVRFLYQRWDGVINEVEEDNTLLIITGNNGFIDRNVNIRLQDQCKNPGQASCSNEIDVSDQSARGPATIRMYLLLSGTGTDISYTLSMADQPEITTGTLTHFGFRTTKCVPCTSENYFESQESTFALPLLINYQGKTSDKNRVTGTKVVDQNFDISKSKLEFSWDFIRRIR